MSGRSKYRPQQELHTNLKLSPLGSPSKSRRILPGPWRLGFADPACRFIDGWYRWPRSPYACGLRAFVGLLSPFLLLLLLLLPFRFISSTCALDYRTHGSRSRSRSRAPLRCPTRPSISISPSRPSHVPYRDRSGPAYCDDMI